MSRRIVSNYRTIVTFLKKMAMNKFCGIGLMLGFYFCWDIYADGDTPNC